MNLSLIILIFIISTDNYFSNNYSIRFYLYFYTFFIIIFNFIINPFLNKFYQDQKNQKTILLSFNLIIPILLIFILLIIVSIDLLLIFFLKNTTAYSLETANEIRFLFLGIPIHLTNYFITKLLILDEKYKDTFMIYLISNILFCFLIYLFNFFHSNIIICYSIIILFQFIYLNFTINNSFNFIIKKFNIFAYSILILIYFLNFINLVDGYHFIFSLFIIIILIKLKFYEKKKLNIFSS